MHKYLSEHINEEIDGALDYMTKALEWKPKNKDIACKFYKMSEMELEHANCLTKMFNSMDKPDDISDSDFSAMYKSILDSYTESMSKIEAMKKIFWE